MRERVITGSELADHLGPLVYVLMREDEILYIGMSGSGVGRAFSSGHHAIGDTIRTTDTLKFIFCDSLVEAELLEAELLLRHRPPLNKTFYGLVRKAERLQKRIKR